MKVAQEKKITSVLSALLVAVGVMAPFCHYFVMGESRARILDTLNLLSVSPLPLVFDRSNFFGETKIYLNFAKRKDPIVISPAESFDFTSPWHFTTNFLHPLMLPDLFTPCDGQANVMRFFMCRETKTNAFFSEVPVSITTVWSPQPGGPGERREKVIPCAVAHD